MRQLARMAMQLGAWLAVVLPAAALALAPVQLCSGQAVTPGADGRLLGHIPYAEAPAGELVPVIPFGIGKPCLMQREPAADIVRLVAAARVAGFAGAFRGLSCFRSISYQRTIFCSKIGPGRACRDAAERARSSAPPGYSEHATGFALDIAVGPLTAACRNVLNDCIADLPAGRWLLAHAAEFGFELSFPNGNVQGMMYEPWHWRWVGATPDTPGATRARSLFAFARANFPAAPGIPEIHLPPIWLNALGQPAPVPSPNPGGGGGVGRIEVYAGGGGRRSGWLGREK